MVYWLLFIVHLFIGLLLLGFVEGYWGLLYLKIRKVSWFLGFLGLGFLVAKNTTKKNTPCFLEDIDLISRIFKISLDGSAGFPAPAFSDIVNFMGFQSFEIFKNVFKNTRGFLDSV